MHGSGDWVGAEEFARWASITPQAARKALRGAGIGRTWRGHLLEVRHIVGRGGHAGQIHQVSLNSLQRALEDPSCDVSPSTGDDTLRLTARTPQGGLVATRFAAIERAVDHPRGSAARAAAVQAQAASGPHSARTLQRWIDQYERYGMSGLARKLPANAGRSRIIVSMSFDAAYLAAGGDPARLAVLGEAMDRKLKSIWQSRAEQGGWAQVRRFAEFELLKICEAEGVQLAPSALRLSRRHVERFAVERIVNIWRNDRKTFDDGKPRIRRDWTGLAPMERVVADVKHLDVVLQRPDGSEAWPKVIGYHDGGTNRVFLYPVLLGRGEGVRQEHVVEGFLAMVADPMWGFPQGLYLDNGTEFAVFERIRSALDLVSHEGARSIIYAKPYNAAATPIENSYKRLDKYLFSTLPGYVGSDRLKKKTQTTGRPPVPFRGSWDNFCETLRLLLIGFNALPVGGQWAGRSADDWVRDKQAAGWRPVTVAPLVLDSAFCTRELRKIDRATLRIGGERYHHDALNGLPHGSPVEVALPWRRGAAPLFRPPGGAWAYVAPDLPYAPTMKEGATDAGRRQRTYQRAVAARARDAEAFDPVAASLEMAGRYTPPAPLGRADRLDAGGELLALADGRQQAAGAASKPMSQDEANRRRRDAQTARMLKNEANVA